MGPKPTRPRWFRPTNDPCWSAFRSYVRAKGSGVNPKLVESDNEFGLHGTLIFAAFKAGYEASRAEQQEMDRSRLIEGLLGREGL